MMWVNLGNKAKCTARKTVFQAVHTKIKCDFQKLASQNNAAWFAGWKHSNCNDIAAENVPIFSQSRFAN